MALEQRTEVEKDPHEGSWGSRARQVSKEYIPEGLRDVARWATGGRICPHYGSEEEGVGGPP